MEIISQSKPTIDETDIELVSQVILSRQIAQGPMVERFEAAMSKFVGVKYAIATNSGTSALHLVLLALDIGEGDGVIVPSHVCTALLNAIGYVGATSCITDINEEYNIAVEDVKRRVTNQTKAIIVPHMFGVPADIDDFLELGIPMIEDCALSVGAQYKGQQVGTFGIASIISFYATKMLTTGEGGMVLTNSAEIAEKIKDLREYDVREDYRIRFNYKMTDIHAALGVNQLRKLPQFIQRRCEIADYYTQYFSRLNIDLPKVKNGKTSVWYRYVVKVPSRLPEIIERFETEGVICDSPIAKPLHNYLGLPDEEYPNTTKAFQSALSIPIYPSLDDAKVARIVDTVVKVLGE